MQNWILFMIIFYGIIITAGVIELLLKKISNYFYKRIGMSFMEQSHKQVTSNDGERR